MCDCCVVGAQRVVLRCYDCVVLLCGVIVWCSCCCAVGVVPFDPHSLTIFCDQVVCMCSIVISSPLCSAHHNAVNCFYDDTYLCVGWAQGLDVMGISQFSGCPVIDEWGIIDAQYPSVSMTNWTTGHGNARYVRRFRFRYCYSLLLFYRCLLLQLLGVEVVIG